MRLPSILIILTAIFSCQKQRKQIEQFVFDIRQISNKTIHRYEFDANGRAKADYSTSIIFRAGIPIDSSKYIKLIEYNSKGQITKVFDSLDSTWQTKFYDESDSLVADYTINNYLDTIRMRTIEYVEGKIKKENARSLIFKFPDNLELSADRSIRTYDTLTSMIEFIYQGERCIKSLSYEKDGTLTEEYEFIYENNLLAKQITYSFLGDSKYIKESTTYSKSKTNNPDRLTIGTQGDTIAFKRTIFQNQRRIVLNYFGQNKMQDINYYDENGELIGIVLLNLNIKVKTVYSFTYDNQGNVIEEVIYRERIDNPLDLQQ